MTAGAAGSLAVRAWWTLDEGVAFLNHGSFGACPRPVLEQQAELRARMEAEPVRFLGRERDALIGEARGALAEFVHADEAGLVFVANATAGVNTVLRCLELEPEGELLTTDHAYNAVRNALNFAAERSRCRVVAAKVPWPVSGAEEIFEALVDRATARTRLCVIDHVTSPTGLVFPVERVVAALAERGIDTLVDGAHAPGMVALDVNRVGAAFYTGNCHKWLCAPKGAAFLYVRADRRDRVRPLSISHGASSPRTDKSRFHLEFDWTGTIDPTPYLCVPSAIRFLGSLVPGGWPGLMEQNHRLAVAARSLLCERLGLAEPCPPELIGSMATLGLPGEPPPADAKRLYDPLQEALMRRFSIEVPVFASPDCTQRLTRVSAQAYNRLADYAKLADALEAML